MVISLNSGRFAVTVAARSFDDENGSYTKVRLSEKISLICFGGDGKLFSHRAELYTLPVPPVRIKEIVDKTVAIFNLPEYNCLNADTGKWNSQKNSARLCGCR